MKYLLLVLFASIPLDIQLLNDAWGEKRKGNDVIVLTALTIMMSILVNKWVHWYSFPFLVWAWHFTFFDYLINILLYRNQIGTVQAKWWDYLGHSTIDSLWRDWDWRVRAAIRGVNLILCIYLFILLN
jgi:hypothetical protein